MLPNAQASVHSLSVSSLYSPTDACVTFDADFRCSQLIWSKNKYLDFDWRDWGCDITSAVMLCILAFCYFITGQIFRQHAHMLITDLPQLPWTWLFFIGQAKIQGAKTIPPMPNVFFYEILALSPPCVHHAEVTRGHWLGNLDEAGGGVGLSGIDPQCAHCAERQKDLFQHCTHGNQLWTSLIVA